MYNCISCAHSLSAIYFCLYIKRQLQFPSSFLKLLFLLLPIISPASFKHPHVLVKCFFYWILTTWVVKWKAPITINRIISCLHLAILFWIWPLCLSQKEHRDLLPLNGKNFAIFVHGNKQHGVVGLHGALITCFICDHQCHNCEHVTKVAESEETMEHEMRDFLMDFFVERKFQESTE